MKQVCPGKWTQIPEKLLHLTVYTPASTIINQWAPNLVKLYMTIRSQLSSIMAVIELEWLQLFALELEKLLYLTLFTL